MQWIIYRYEDNEGVGPYRSSLLDTMHYIGVSHSNQDIWPTMYRDWPYDNTKTMNAYHAAFERKEDLTKWFWKYNGKLIALGYNLVEIKVKYRKLSRSGKQVFFRKQDIIEKIVIK